MTEITTKINVGNTVWWVNYFGRVHKGTVEKIEICEGQGALYCVIHSPSNRINTYPIVHYSNVFLSREEARTFAAYQIENPDDVVPMCMGCHYNAMRKEGADNES